MMVVSEQAGAETEAERVEQWRSEVLRQAGYGAAAAGELPSRHSVDLHTAVDLIVEGCPEALALRILL